MKNSTVIVVLYKFVFRPYCRRNKLFCAEARNSLTNYELFKIGLFEKVRLSKNAL